MKQQEITSSVLGALGITLSVQDLTQIINLVLLIISIINILWGLGTRIYSHIKKKEYEKIEEDLNNAMQELNNIKEDKKDV